MVLRVGLRNHLTNIAPLFAADWFGDASIAIFDIPSCFLNRCGHYFSAFLFLFHVFTFLLKIFKPVAIKYRLHVNISFLNSIVCG